MKQKHLFLFAALALILAPSAGQAEPNPVPQKLLAQVHAITGEAVVFRDKGDTYIVRRVSGELYLVKYRGYASLKCEQGSYSVPGVPGVCMGASLVGTFQRKRCVARLGEKPTYHHMDSPAVERYVYRKRPRKNFEWERVSFCRDAIRETFKALRKSMARSRRASE